MKSTFIIPVTLFTASVFCITNGMCTEQKNSLDRMDTIEYVQDLNKTVLELFNVQEGLFKLLIDSTETIKSRHIPTKIFSNPSGIDQSINNIDTLRNLWSKPHSTKSPEDLKMQIEGYKQTNDNTIKLYKEVDSRLDIILEKSKPLGFHTSETKQKFQDLQNQIVNLKKQLNVEYTSFITKMNVAKGALNLNQTALNSSQFQLAFVNKINDIYQNSLTLYIKLS